MPSNASFYPVCALPNGLNGIPFELQTPAALLDQGREALSQRFYIDINTNGEALLVTILVDDIEYVFPNPTTPRLLSTVGRQTVEMPFQVVGRIYSLRLTGCLSFGQIEFFEAWADIAIGDSPSGQQASTA